jgi:hypothetical protein
MKFYDYTKDVFPCWIGDDTYYFYYPDPDTRNGGRTFSGVATAWKENDEANKFLVPYFVKGDEIDLTQDAIRKGIERYVRGERAWFSI